MALLSCSASLTLWLAFAMATSSVCALIHERCSSEFSLIFSPTSRFKCTIVASNGPASSSNSATPAEQERGERGGRVWGAGKRGGASVSSLQDATLDFCCPCCTLLLSQSAPPIHCLIPLLSLDPPPCHLSHFPLLPPDILSKGEQKSPPFCSAPLL